MQFFHLYQTIFFHFLCFPNMMYKLNIVSTIKNMTIKDFIYENYYSQIGFTKENSYYSIERQKKD